MAADSPERHPSPRSPRAVALLGALVVALSASSVLGCGVAGSTDAGGTADPNAVSTDPAAVIGTVTVLAAASLTDAFTAIADAFESSHPGVEIRLGFGASSSLAAQIAEGAPADVFAAADFESLGRLRSAGAEGSPPEVFATTRPEIIVAPGNPEGIRHLADLASPELTVVACAPQVPCGRYADAVLDQADVDVTFRSLEENVRAVVSKVTMGEADAGIVYATDVIAAGERAEGVPLPTGIDVVVRYPIVPVASNSNPVAARAFIEFVRSATGQQILESFGFDAP